MGNRGLHAETQGDRQGGHPLPHFSLSVHLGHSVGVSQLNEGKLEIYGIAETIQSSSTVFSLIVKWCVFAVICWSFWIGLKQSLL